MLKHTFVGASADCSGHPTDAQLDWDDGIWFEGQVSTLNFLLFSSNHSENVDGTTQGSPAEHCPKHHDARPLYCNTSWSRVFPGNTHTRLSQVLIFTCPLKAFPVCSYATPRANHNGLCILTAFYLNQQWALATHDSVDYGCSIGPFLILTTAECEYPTTAAVSEMFTPCHLAITI